MLAKEMIIQCRGGKTSSSHLLGSMAGPKKYTDIRQMNRVLFITIFI